MCSVRETDVSYDYVRPLERAKFLALSKAWLYSLAIKQNVALYRIGTVLNVPYWLCGVLHRRQLYSWKSRHRDTRCVAGT